MKEKREGKFLERLKKEVILADGAMGTYLVSLGVPIETSLETVNLTQPKLVERVHREYIKAGAELIATNTFGANCFKLKKYGRENNVKKLNRIGAEIAKGVSGDKVFVAGSIGPLGKGIKPYGALKIREATRAFAQQIEGLLEGGVDLLLIETVSTLLEAKTALSIAKKMTELPVVCQLTYRREDYSTDRLLTALKELEENGADVVGLNCFLGPAELFEIISEVRKYIAVPFSVFPNAGYPALIEGRTFFLSSPEYFNKYTKKFLEIGVNLIGGCCGTTPEHIEAMKEAAAGEKVRRITLIEVPEKERIVPKIEKKRNSFLEKLKKEFVVTVEIGPPRNSDYKSVLEICQVLKNWGLETVDIPDNPMAKSKMSALALGHLIKKEIGLNVLLHLTCRDRNLIGLQSELLGAQALGIEGIIALTGDPASLGDYPQARSVYDLNSVELVQLTANLNQGKDWLGNSTESETSLAIGIAFNPAAENINTEIEKFKRKVESGAHFALTQPIYDDRLLEGINGAAIPVLIGILPLKSFKQALFLNNEVPGINIPEEIMKRMEKARNPKKEGLEITKRFVRRIKNRVKGIYIMPSLDNIEIVKELLEDLK